jgi:hypothetical protein
MMHQTVQAQPLTNEMEDESACPEVPVDPLRILKAHCNPVALLVPPHQTGNPQGSFLSGAKK